MSTKITIPFLGGDAVSAVFLLKNATVAGDKGWLKSPLMLPAELLPRLSPSRMGAR